MGVMGRGGNRYGFKVTLLLTLIFFSFYFLALMQIFESQLRMIGKKYIYFIYTIFYFSKLQLDVHYFFQSKIWLKFPPTSAFTSNT